MIRGTTPRLKFKIKHLPVELIESVIITFAQNGKKIFEKTDSEITIDQNTNVVMVDLSSEDTLQFKADDELIVTLTVFTTDGKVGSSKDYYFDIKASAHFD